MKKQYAENYRQLGINITFYRRQRNLTQMQLADMIDMSLHQINKIELCKVGASLDTVFAIADALEVPAHKLFELKD